MAHQAQLSDRRHSSPWWISQTRVASLGVKILPDQVHLGYVLPNENVVYNVDQTDSGAILSKHAGNIYPTWLLDGKHVFGELKAFLFSNLANYESNLWISRDHIQKLGLSLCSDMEPFDPKLQFQGCEPMAYWNASSIKKSLLPKLENKWPRSAYTGRRYPAEVAFKLFREALEKDYTSVCWITRNTASKLNIKVRKEAKPVEVVTQLGPILLYNAEQTENPNLIYCFTVQNATLPRNAFTGMAYPQPMASQLLLCAARSSLPCSLYWVSKRDADIIGISIDDFDDDRCVTIKTEHETLCVYNANMTSDAKLVNYYAKKQLSKSLLKVHENCTIFVREPLDENFAEIK